MIFEFLGTTGSGKSTLIPAVMQFLQTKNIKALSVTEAIHEYMGQSLTGRLVKLFVPRPYQKPVLWRIFSYGVVRWHSLKFMVKHSCLTWYVVTFQFRRPIPLPHRWLILRLFFNMVGQYAYFQNRLQSGQVIVFDEGFVHRTTHLFVSATEYPDVVRIEKYLSLIPRPEQIIFVKASPDQCLSRINRRGLQVRLRNLPADSVAIFVQHAARVVDVVSTYAKTAGWQIIEIDNNSDLSAGVNQLQSKLKNLDL